MSRQFKARPDNPLTERYRKQINNVTEEEYIESQRKIGENIMIIDDGLDNTFIKNFYLDAFFGDKDNKEYEYLGKWSPNIGYGNEKWPVDEWGYDLVRPQTKEWLDSPMKENGKKLWGSVNEYFKDTFDVDLVLYGAHINATVFGQESKIHRDSSDGTDVFVIIFYNENMNVYDGGELQTYVGLNPDEINNKDFYESEVNYSINPKLGRMVLADARILHRGLAPTRFFAESRMTSVFKCKLNNIDEDYKKLGFVW
tara:strand:- start:358 stop:1122 length:765 start_codon:yes stop_codon:yes gene_type:complete